MIDEEIKNLINEAKAGNAEAFSRVYEEYLTPIYRFIYFRVKDKSEADDLTQEVFLKVFNFLDRFETNNGSPLAYFYTVARNLLIDSYRKKKSVSLDIETVSETLISEDDSEISATKNEDILRLKKALEKIPQKEREVLILKFIDDYSNKEIAEIVGKSETAIRQCQSRGLKSLRKFINKEDLNI